LGEKIGVASKDRISFRPFQKKSKCALGTYSRYRFDGEMLEVVFVAAGLAMLIAQGTTQMASGDATATANNRSPVMVEANTTSGPSELTALTSTTVLMASHANNGDSYNDLESAAADDGEQETNL